MWKDEMPVLGIICIVFSALSAVVCIGSFCVRNGHISDRSEEWEKIEQLPIEIELKKDELSVVENKRDVIARAISYLSADSSNFSSVDILNQSMAIVIEDIMEIESQIADKEEYIAKKSSDTREDVYQRDLEWHIVLMIRCGIAIALFLSTLTISLIDFDGVIYNMKLKAKEKPTSIYIVTLASGKYQIVYRRGFFTIRDKEYKTYEEAIEFTDRLKQELIEKNWHKAL